MLVLMFNNFDLKSQMEVKEMFYEAVPSRIVQLFNFSLTIFLMILVRHTPEMYYFLIPFSVVILATIFMKFNLKITGGSLTYKILVFSLTIYKREIPHSQILAMKFKRAGWGKKFVIVKNKKAFNFRIIEFYPKSIYIDLIDFANKYGIPISKTKDYLILERLQ
ncbi:hypothetical protein SAMN04487943_102127 [Gracilibacillus orientalis]|uniref:Uncharacterized protein n=2 Tax=Gracilibacillus orientalis TaxID=334253 RepID=A0A1I4II51_9BACI|nr:hypothetical protein SAMN04487943_102127 [Gracilibacillus orientalis]